VIVSGRLFNLIRRTVSAYGGSEQLADALVTEMGDEFLDSVDARFSALHAEKPPPRNLGMTELEAAMRWCPQAREVTALDKKTQHLGNRYLDGEGDFANPAGCRCIGSYCLAWRWIDPLRGYCGLAGVPRFQPLGEPRRLTNRTPLERPHESLERDLFE
jgi:hypothetical protein